MANSGNVPEKEEVPIKQLDLTPESNETPEEIKAEQEAERLSRLEAGEKLAEFSKSQGTVDGSQKDLEIGLSNLTPVTDDDQKNDEASQPVIETNEVPAKDVPWVKKVEEIIEKDKDDPYREQEDEEEISQKYLSDRLNIEVEDQD